MILRRIARPLLSAIFVSGGVNALRQLEGHTQAVKPWLDENVAKYADSLPESVPTDARTLVQIDAGVKIGAGAALAFGKAPRVAALLLLGSLTATTAAAHRFWEESEQERRDDQLVHFLKNCGLAGGLLLAAADTHGKPSAAWLARHGAHMAGKRMSLAGHAAELYAAQTLKHNTKHAKRGAKRAKLGMGKAGKGFRKTRHGGMRTMQRTLLEAQKDGARKAHKARKVFGKGRKHGLAKAQHGFQQAQKSGMRKAQHGIKQAQKSDLARKAQHQVKQARKSDLARNAQHHAKQVQHMSQARARQARGYARSAIAR